MKNRVGLRMNRMNRFKSCGMRFRPLICGKGGDNVYCRRDLCLLFNLVLASLDRMSALKFSLLGMCWTHTRSKAYWMTLRTK